jgi:hypothetical protein
MIDHSPARHYAVLAGILTCPVSEMWSRLWKPTAEMTFWVVAWLPRPLVPGLAVDSPAKVIGTERFTVPHGTTNALLAGWVLLGGNWEFW